VLMVKAYAATLERPLDTVARWVEKTPANRNHIAEIYRRFPHAKILVTNSRPARHSCGANRAWRRQDKQDGSRFTM